jgi:hypothetical protein
VNAANFESADLAGARIRHLDGTSSWSMSTSRGDEVQRRLAKHEAALSVLRESDADGTPFVLYLRKYDIHVLHGPTQPERRSVDEMLIDALPDGARILSVQESPPGEVIRSVWSPRMPSLYLQETEDWKSIVQPIIYRAELIVSEFTFLSEGVRWELETCRAFGKHHQTVLIVPPPRTAFAPLDHLRPLDQFPRVLWADHLFTERLSEAFVLKDLLERVATIARLPAQERLKLFAEDGLKARVPISYEGVLAGYRARANDWETRAALQDDGTFDYYRFWDWFRIGAILGVLVRERKTLSLDEAGFDLTYAYLMLLQGIAHRVVPIGAPGSFLTSDFVDGVASTVQNLLGTLGPRAWPVKRLAELTFARLGYTLQDDQSH